MMHSGCYAPIVAVGAAARRTARSGRGASREVVESLLTACLFVVVVALGEAHAQERYSEDLEILDDLSSTEVTEAADLDAASSIEPYPAEDRGLDPIVEETREVPPEVVERLQLLKARIDHIADERVAKGAGSVAESNPEEFEVHGLPVRFRPEAPPAMDSGVPNPDVIEPDSEIVDEIPDIAGDVRLNAGGAQ